MQYGMTSQNKQVDPKEINSILDFAYHNGINNIDTARLYGNSEDLIGKYLKNNPKQNWSITTKINNKNICFVEQVTESLKRLNIKSVSVLAHNSELLLNHKFLSELAELKKKKIINKIGVSVYTENEINQIQKFGFKPDIIQLPINILDTRLFHKGILKKINNNGIEIHARSVFLKGLFFLPIDKIKERFPDAQPQIIKLSEIAEKEGITLPELSLLWLVNMKEINNVIIGIERLSQLKSNIQTITKKVDKYIFQESLSIKYDNENVLNPSLWV